MDITIKSRYFTREQRGLMTDLSEWCGIKLLGPRMSRNVELLIRIVNPKSFKMDRTYGTSEIHDDDDRRHPRSFVVTTTNHFGTLRTLMVLAHEMVHVKQHALRELSYCGRTGQPRWHGKIIDDPNISYWDLPWEIEAHGREKGLVYQWAEDRGHNVSAKWHKELF